MAELVSLALSLRNRSCGHIYSSATIHCARPPFHLGLSTAKCACCVRCSVCVCETGLCLSGFSTVISTVRRLNLWTALPGTGQSTVDRLLNPLSRSIVCSQNPR
eukprot:COSAG01_NODE_5895_length_3965_cov_2.461718_3_plen_104_part_00